MSDGTSYADLVILALIAGFILLRLRSVLGQKTGFEKPPTTFKDTIDIRPDDVIAQMQQQQENAKREDLRAQDDEYIAKINDSTAKEAVLAIKATDSNFTLKHFIEGAQNAFEMVFSSFNKGDKQTLQMLLSPALYDVFAAEYDARQKQDVHAETTLVFLESAEVAAAKLEKNKASITLRFVSEQVTVMRNQQGEIVEGNASQTERVEDLWVFEREITSRNPNWKIIET